MRIFWRKDVITCLIVILLPFIPISNFPSNQQGVIEQSNLYNPYEKIFVSEFEQFTENLLDKTKTPGAAIGIVKGNSVLYTKGIGLKAANSKDSVDAHTIFRIASLSKGFTSVLAGILAQDSLFNLNDSVRKYLPEFTLKSENQSNQLEIRHLLSHTSGLPRHSFTNLIEDGDSLKNMIAALKEVDLIARPGDLYSYQNVAFSVAGEIIEAVTHETYTQQLSDRIFTPLEMHDASASYDEIINAENVAIPHGYGRKSWEPIDISDKYYNAAPAGGINASATDMAQWLKLLLGEREDLVKGKTLEQLYKPAIRTPIKYRYYRNWDNVKQAYYGMGWRVVVTGSDTLLHHGGYVNGYRNEIAFSPKDDIGIVVLTNAPTDFAAKSVPVFFNMFYEYKDAIEHWNNLNRKIGKPL